MRISSISEPKPDATFISVVLGLDPARLEVTTETPPRGHVGALPGRPAAAKPPIPAMLRVTPSTASPEREGSPLMPLLVNVRRVSGGLEETEESSPCLEVTWRAASLFGVLLSPSDEGVKTFGSSFSHFSRR